MKFLCVCQYGHSRSVAMCRALHRCHETAIACGWGTASKLLPAMCELVDKICIMEASFAQFIPEQHRHKIWVCDVGPDIWSNPYHPDLAAKCEAFVAQLGAAYH